MSVLAARATPLLCGHRGSAATHPENTLVSFEAALDAGCAAIELDAHVTADSRLAVIHDATVDRTTDGTGEVGAMTLAQLRELDAREGERVPRLDDVLELCRSRGAIALVELKSAFDRWPDASELVADAAERCAMRGSALLLAFDHRHLAHAREATPWLARVPLMDSVPEDPIALLDSLDAEAIAPRWDAVDARLCERVHDAGRRVVTWTVDDERAAVRLAEIGVDVIVTNDPARVGAVLRAALMR